MSNQLYCEYGRFKECNTFITCLFIGGRLDKTHVQYKSNEAICTYQEDEEYQLFYLDQALAIFVEKELKVVEAMKKICSFVGQQIAVY